MVDFLLFALLCFILILVLFWVLGKILFSDNDDDDYPNYGVGV